MASNAKVINDRYKKDLAKAAKNPKKAFKDYTLPGYISPSFEDVEKRFYGVKTPALMHEKKYRAKHASINALIVAVILAIMTTSPIALLLVFNEGAMTGGFMVWVFTLLMYIFVLIVVGAAVWLVFWLPFTTILQRPIELELYRRKLEGDPILDYWDPDDLAFDVQWREDVLSLIDANSNKDRTNLSNEMINQQPISPNSTETKTNNIKLTI